MGLRTPRCDRAARGGEGGASGALRQAHRERTERERPMREKVKQEATPPHRAGVTGSPAIELRALCKAFGTLQAVDHLTLAVEQGEILACWDPTARARPPPSI